MNEEQDLTEQLEAVSAEQLELSSQQERLPENQYCVFRAGRERFCLAVLDVEEVVEWPSVTRMPLTPSFLMGIFNLRGSIIPVIDIALTEARRPDLSPRHVVVARQTDNQNCEDVRVGIAADEVFGTFTTSEPLVLADAPREVPHCCGMLKHEDRLALALDLKRLVETFPVPVL